MVATSIHFIFAVALARMFGYKDNKKYMYGLWGILPDIDGIILGVLIFIKSIFGLNFSFLETNQTLVMLFAHRGISHSLTFLVIIVLFLLLINLDLKKVGIIASLIGLHLFLDLIAAWKLFLLLPFSYWSTSLGLVEIFDPILTLLSTIILGLIISESIERKDDLNWSIFAFVFVIFFGFVLGLFMRELSISAAIISLIAFFTIIGTCYRCKFYGRSLQKLGLDLKFFYKLTMMYVIGLIILKLFFMAQIGVPFNSLEPLEETGFNFHAHTFEVEQLNHYQIGIISYRGVEEERTAFRYYDNTNGKLTADIIGEYEKAYEKAIHLNWFNNPIFTFYEDEEEGLYVNIRYAKTFLMNEHMPGPRLGLNATLQDGILVGYPQSWFS